MNNKTCPTCGNKFHSCSSCNFWNGWEYLYCSEKCWVENIQKSLEGKRFKAFWISLNDAQKHILNEAIMEFDKESLLKLIGIFSNTLLKEKGDGK